MWDGSPATYSVYCKSTSQGSHTKIMWDSSPAAYSVYCKSTSQGSILICNMCVLHVPTLVSYPSLCTPLPQQDGRSLATTSQESEQTNSDQLTRWKEGATQHIILIWQWKHFSSSLGPYDVLDMVASDNTHYFHGYVQWIHLTDMSRCG